MANENYSASGSATFVVEEGNLIDNPDFIIYVGTTGSDVGGDGSVTNPYKTPQKAIDSLSSKRIGSQGFVTIQCGAGRYGLSKPIELSHPDSLRIGIRGADVKHYYMTKCAGFTSSHGTTAEVQTIGKTVSIKGTTAERSYISSIRLNDLDWATTERKNIGLRDGVSGDFVLIRDFTLAHEKRYSPQEEEYGVTGARRMTLCGCFEVTDNYAGANNSGSDDPNVTGKGLVNLIHKFHNAPLFDQYSAPASYVAGQETKGIQIGGLPSAYTDTFKYTPTEGGINAGPIFEYATDPSPRLVKTANSGLNFDETVFGNTAEGLESDEIASSIGVTGYISPLQINVNNGTARGNRKFFIKEPSTPAGAAHITDNKMVASHIRTIFDFSDYNEPGIKLEGDSSGLGFLHNVVLSGPWKQFEAHSHGVTNDDITGQGDGSSIHSDKNAGIFMSNASQMVYALGTTGEKRARETLRSEFGTLAEDGIFGGVSMNKISSSDITMLNVGISGFKRGVYVTNDSFASCKTVVISNCDIGLDARQNSSVDASHSVFTGIEGVGAQALYDSSVTTHRTMYSNMSHAPFVYYTFMVDQENLTDTDNTRFLRSFIPGDPIALANGSEANAFVGDPVGIVKMVFPNKERQGFKVLFYNYRNNYGVLPNAKKVQQFGFTLDTIRAPGLTSDSTISQDTIGHDRGGLTASSGGTRILSASFYGNGGIGGGVGRGTAISSHNNSDFEVRESTFSYLGANAIVAGSISKVSAPDCSFSQSFRGLMVSSEAHIGCAPSTFNTLIESAGRANSSATLNVGASVVNNCRYAVLLENNSSAEVGSINVHEGLSEHMVNMFKVYHGSHIKGIGYGIFFLGPRYGGNCIPIDPDITDESVVNASYAENFIADIDVTSFAVPNTGSEGTFGDDLAGDIFSGAD